jgi:hypothetical protein
VSPGTFVDVHDVSECTESGSFGFNLAACPAVSGTRSSPSSLLAPLLGIASALPTVWKERKKAATAAKIEGGRGRGRRMEGMGQEPRVPRER